MHELAPIYTEENLWDRLWDLVQKTGDFETAWRYHDLLVKQYPLELLDIYLPSLAQQLKEKYPRRPAMVEELNKILK